MANEPNQSNSSNGNENCADADAEAEEDALPSMKPGFEAQPFLSIANCMNKPVGYTNTNCNFNTHV